MAAKPLYLSGEAAADALLSEDPLALLIGLVLDQQVPLERAFSAPYALRERIGAFDAARLAAMEPAELAGAFSAKPALHRFPAAMAERVQRVAQVLVAEYEGDIARLWGAAPDGRALVRTLRALPGFGEQKAKIFAALLGKQLGVRPSGWREACAPYGAPRTRISIADIDGPESLLEVRDHKRQMKAAAKSVAKLEAPSHATRARR